MKTVVPVVQLKSGP